MKRIGIFAKRHGLIDCFQHQLWIRVSRHADKFLLYSFLYFSPSTTSSILNGLPVTISLLRPSTLTPILLGHWHLMSLPILSFEQRPRDRQH